LEGPETHKKSNPTLAQTTQQECSNNVFGNRRLSRSSENASDKLGYFYVLSKSPSVRCRKSHNPNKLGYIGARGTTLVCQIERKTQLSGLKPIGRMEGARSMCG